MKVIVPLDPYSACYCQSGLSRGVVEDYVANPTTGTSIPRTNISFTPGGYYTGSIPIDRHRVLAPVLAMFT
jgi:hypothetical protein